MHSAADPFNFSKLLTKLQISAHTTADILNHEKPSVHTAAEVVHAHSWDLTFLTKQALALHQFILHQKPKLTSLQEFLFIVHLLQYHGLKPWAPRTLNPGLKPWVYYKKEGFYSTPTPLRLF